MGSEKVRKKTNFVDHVLMRNDFYIFSGFPSEWVNEARIKDDKHSVICDAWFKSNGKFYILEVDLLQKMKENRNKIAKYRGLLENGVIKENLGYFPTLIWVTTTELRKRQLKELCNGIPCLVYTIDEIRRG